MLFNRLVRFMMFANKFPIPLSKTIIKSKPIAPIIQAKPIKNKTIYYPNPAHKSLFRCVYILNNGVEEYKNFLSDPQLIIKEIELSINYIEKCREWFIANKNNKDLKRYVSLKTLEAELIDRSLNISLSSFFTLCAVFNKSIYFESNSFIMRSGNLTGEYYQLLKQTYDDKIHYGIDYMPKNNITIDNNKVIVTSFSKPLYCSSYYKLNELVDMSKKFNLSTESKNKQDLYAQIQIYYKENGLNYKT